MVPYSLLQPRPSVSFEDKIKLSASQRLSLARSKLFTVPETEPQRKDRKTHSNLVVPQLCDTKKRTGIFLLNVAHEGDRREESPKFISLYQPPNALDSELMFVKARKYISGPYKNPKPQDSRSLNEDLPGNLDFKLKHLDIIRTTRSESNSSSRDTKEELKRKTNKAHLGCEACSPTAALAFK